MNQFDIFLKTQNHSIYKHIWTISLTESAQEINSLGLIILMGSLPGVVGGDGVEMGNI